MWQRSAKTAKCSNKNGRTPFPWKSSIWHLCTNGILRLDRQHHVIKLATIKWWSLEMANEMEIAKVDLPKLMGSTVVTSTWLAAFSGASVESSAKDTARGVLRVLDQEGNEKQVLELLEPYILPPIKDVGVLRTRYPVFPSFGEGSFVWKELNAKREVMNEDKWQRHVLEECWSQPGNEDITLLMGYSTCACAPRHTHEIKLDAAVQMLKVASVDQRISLINAHFHSVLIRYDPSRSSTNEQCDGNSSQCWDKHVRRFTVAQD